MVIAGCCEAIIAIFLPPLAVLLRRGCGLSLLLNLLLTLLGWIPGVIHAWLVIIAEPSRHSRSRSRGPTVVHERDEYYRTSRAGKSHHHHHHSSGGRHQHHTGRHHARPVSARRGYEYAGAGYGPPQMQMGYAPSSRSRSRSRY